MTIAVFATSLINARALDSLKAYEKFGRATESASIIKRVTLEEVKKNPELAKLLEGKDAKLLEGKDKAGQALMESLNAELVKQFGDKVKEQIKAENKKESAKEVDIDAKIDSAEKELAKCKEDREKAISNAKDDDEKEKEQNKHDAIVDKAEKKLEGLKEEKAAKEEKKEKKEKAASKAPVLTGAKFHQAEVLKAIKQLFESDKAIKDDQSSKMNETVRNATINALNTEIENDQVKKRELEVAGGRLDGATAALQEANRNLDALSQRKSLLEESIRDQKDIIKGIQAGLRNSRLVGEDRIEKQDELNTALGTLSIYEESLKALNENITRQKEGVMGARKVVSEVKNSIKELDTQITDNEEARSKLKKEKQFDIKKKEENKEKHEKNRSKALESLKKACPEAEKYVFSHENDADTKALSSLLNNYANPIVSAANDYDLEKAIDSLDIKKVKEELAKLGIAL